METRFRLSHPVHVPRPADEQEAREDLLDDRADLRQRQARTGARSHAFLVQKGIGDRGDDHVMLPAGVRAPVEVIEPEFRFEFLVLLLDRPSLMGRPHQRAQAGCRGQIADVVPVVGGGGRGPGRSLTEQPHVRQALVVPPTTRRA